MAVCTALVVSLLITAGDVFFIYENLRDRDVRSLLWPAMGFPIFAFSVLLSAWLLHLRYSRRTVSDHSASQYAPYGRRRRSRHYLVNPKEFGSLAVGLRDISERGSRWNSAAVFAVRLAAVACFDRPIAMTLLPKQRHFQRGITSPHDPDLLLRCSR